MDNLNKPKKIAVYTFVSYGEEIQPNDERWSYITNSWEYVIPGLINYCDNGPIRRQVKQ